MHDSRRVSRGVVAGVLAAVAGYAVTFLLRVEALDAATSEGGRFAAASISAPAWKAAGWLWAGAHHVTIRASAWSLWEGTVHPVAPTAGGPWQPVLFAVPVVALLCAGGLLAGGSPSTRAAAKRGAAVAFGYAPMAAVSLYAFRWRSSIPTTLPEKYTVVVLDPVATLAVMGLAFPILLGALGGRIRHASPL